ncbi:RrF2 family transcriptional regulator [Humisphaera borealis]|uniref:Rrf2 family transcriptional regulator n=1 Tax=Humisphaera borealis TaxID=2807512 RepID=A0A7M2X253_9BACT|nr:Rrf2 family transcriptional regulator [Humisphaera borealis]QOV90830.1 Rrf2 family transcriptional regulator [Humisphaera borealis]
MFSQTVEYALRVMTHLAVQEGPVTTRQIAVATKVPEGYLAKVIQTLGRAGLVHSQRGLHGGSVLGRAAADITIFDIVNAIDPVQRIHTCPLGLKSHGVNLCPLHKRMDAALDMVEQAFKDSTLAELLAEPTRSRPLCDIEFAEATPSFTAKLTEVAKK